MRLIFSRQFYFIIGFFFGTLSGLGLNFVLAQTSYELEQQAYFKEKGEYLQITEDEKKGIVVNTYSAECKGYQVVYKNKDGSETAIGYGALADDYTYEKKSPIITASSTDKLR